MYHVINLFWNSSNSLVPWFPCYLFLIKLFLRNILCKHFSTHLCRVSFRSVIGAVTANDRRNIGFWVDCKEIISLICSTLMVVILNYRFRCFLDVVTYVFSPFRSVLWFVVQVDKLKSMRIQSMVISVIEKFSTNLVLLNNYYFYTFL